LQAFGQCFQLRLAATQLTHLVAEVGDLRPALVGDRFDAADVVVDLVGAGQHPGEAEQHRRYQAFHATHRHEQQATHGGFPPST